MATLHNRMCEAGFYTDDELLMLPRDVRTFFRDLWHIAEDSGCLEDRPFGWKILLYPSPLDSDVTVEVICGWRDALVESGHLVKYRSKGKDCVFITTFLSHQKLTNPGESKVPTPPWVELVKHPTDSRKRSYKVTGEVGQPLGNGTATVGLPGTEPNRTEEEPNRTVHTEPVDNSEERCAFSTEELPQAATAALSAIGCLDNEDAVKSACTLAYVARSLAMSALDGCDDEDLLTDECVDETFARIARSHKSKPIKRPAAYLTKLAKVGHIGDLVGDTFVTALRQRGRDPNRKGEFVKVGSSC